MKTILLYKIYQQKLTDLNSWLWYLSCTSKNSWIKFRHKRNIFENFKYILVDEYKIQMHTSKRLFYQKNKNICCVGDDDQSIYSWRCKIKIFEFDQVIKIQK